MPIEVCSLSMLCRCVCRYGAPPGLDYQCDHIDGNPENNAKENLQWLSPQAHKEKTDRETRACALSVRAFAQKAMAAFMQYPSAAPPPPHLVGERLGHSAELSRRVQVAERQ
uniref:HNH nuclease domain-containing protein n=1 Tax=Coccolithus braarudii TaxID=221442 RepID=A0A7S0Q7C1_9EUKA|mmetsp:Transcript_43492/g.92552  ORF Transcript_43492/g.92552 Transcript_43492/m.92552 type:complete len:112 (-) Transcript_43492:101-436(-)